MKHLLCITAATLAAFAPSSLSAQAYPAKPVRVVVGFAPGGSTDVVARLVARKLTDSFKQPFVVENRAGAASNIAAELVARAPADGHTLLYMTSTLAVNASLYSKLPFNLLEDFAPVAPVVDIPSVLCVHPSLPVRTVKELVALARARRGEITYGSAGNGSATHLATELFKSMAGNIDIVHVPYKGSGPATNDFLGGHVQVLFVFNATLVSANAKNGKLRPLAATSRDRLSNFPDIPTMSEAGIQGYEASVWNAVLAPAGTSREILARVNREIAQAARDITPQLTEMGAFPMYATPDELAAFLRREVTKWAGVVRRSGAKAE